MIEADGWFLITTKGSHLYLLEAWLNNKTIANTEAWLSDPQNYAIVAEVDDSIVGFGLSQSEEVLLCYITPEVRHKGVGKSLLRTMEAHAANAGITELRFESTRTAEAFYRRNGFESTGPVIVAFGMEGLPMAKRLGYVRRHRVPDHEWKIDTYRKPLAQGFECHRV